MKSHTAETRQLGNLKLRIRRQEIKEYKYQGETFQLDDSEGCYVTVTYKHLKGHAGVNIGSNASTLHPFAWHTGVGRVTPDGVQPGTSCLQPGTSLDDFFNEHRDSLCADLLRIIRAEEASKAFEPEKYCTALTMP